MHNHCAGVDTFFSKAVAFGAALHFRALMYEGLGRATQSETPLLYNNVQSLYHQYPANLHYDAAFKVCCISVKWLDFDS
jgi:hypothetical protein